MSLLLSSVSASAITAGVPPVSGPLLTYVDHAATGTDNTAISLSFPEVGFYIVGVGGASGGAGNDDSPITLTSSTTPATLSGIRNSSSLMEQNPPWVGVLPLLNQISQAHTLPGTVYQPTS